MALSKTVFIDRENRATARAAFDSAAAHMRREKQSVFIFPEGTRSYAATPDLLPFKKGAFHLAIQAQVPIVPIVVANYAHMLSAKARIFRPGVIDVSGEWDASLLASPTISSPSPSSSPSLPLLSIALFSSATENVNTSRIKATRTGLLMEPQCSPRSPPPA